jgi:hypothetical protein
MIFLRKLQFHFSKSPMALFVHVVTQSVMIAQNYFDTSS